MRGSVNGMILCASYETGTGNLQLSVILPAERTISFGEHVYTGPCLEFAKEGADIMLIVKALLNVKLDTQPEPLKCSFLASKLPLREQQLMQPCSTNGSNQPRWVSR